MLTAEQAIEQAHDTFDLVYPDHDGEYSEQELRALWDFAYFTRMAAADNGDEVCTLAELAAAFAEPRGCPTGQGVAA